MAVEDLKMYILVRESVPLGLAMTAVAHASAAAVNQWVDADLDDADFADWLLSSFRKVICKVTDKEFERAKGAVGKHERIVMTESALSLGGSETAAVFMPREEMPKMFRYLRLYK